MGNQYTVVENKNSKNQKWYDTTLFENKTNRIQWTISKTLEIETASSSTKTWSAVNVGSPTKSRKDGRCPYIPDYRTDPWSLESGVLNNECLCGQSELRQMSERARDDLSNGGP